MFLSNSVLSRGGGSLLLYVLNDSVLVILLVLELAFKFLGLSYELPRSIDSTIFDEDMLRVSLFARSSAVREISGAQSS
jgi:hypothetical protein